MNLDVVLELFVILLDLNLNLDVVDLFSFDSNVNLEVDEVFVVVLLVFNLNSDFVVVFDILLFLNLKFGVFKKKKLVINKCIFYLIFD